MLHSGLLCFFLLVMPISRAGLCWHVSAIMCRLQYSVTGYAMVALAEQRDFPMLRCCHHL